MKLSLFDCTDCATSIAMPEQVADSAEELNCPVCGLELDDEVEEEN